MLCECPYHIISYPLPFEATNHSSARPFFFVCFSPQREKYEWLVVSYTAAVPHPRTGALGTTSNQEDSSPFSLGLPLLGSFLLPLPPPLLFIPCHHSVYLSLVSYTQPTLVLLSTTHLLFFSCSSFSILSHGKQ